MTKDAKAAQKQRLAEALRANLRRRKAAQGMRIERQDGQGGQDGAGDPRADDASQGTR